MEPTKDLTLDSFIDQLLTEPQFKDLEPEVHAQLKSDLSGRLENHINAALLKELNDEQMDAFQSKLDAGANGEELQSFLKDNISEIDAVVASALIKFRASYLGY